MIARSISAGTTYSERNNMKLYLVRHGDYSMVQQQDVLSEKGQNEIISLANFLSRLNIQVSNILHSGKLRARQTAELLAKGMICDQPVQSRNGLNPNDDVTAFANEIAHWGDDVLVVGHMPFMGRLVSELLTGSENRELVDFQTGVMVCLEIVGHSHWMVRWVLTPEILLTD
jgi:phosphohistidine phosphatase